MARTIRGTQRSFSSGINEETGFLLLIPGFGGHARSNVYKKMRRVFADKYTISYEHMLPFFHVSL